MKERTKVKNRDGRVGLGRLLLWNSSSVSVALTSLVLGYVTIYCTNALGMEPVLVGTIFMVSKLVDSVTDVIAGFIIDRTQTKWGKGRPYEIFMVFLWLSTWLLFSCPEGFGTTAKCIWIFCMYTFMNAICVTFLNANNVIYMVRAFKTKEQQVKVTAYGSFFTMGSAMIFNIGFPILMSKMATSAAGWSRLVGMLAIPLTALGVLRMLTIPEQYNNEAEKNEEKLKLKDIVVLVKTNRPILIITLVRFAQNVVTGLTVAVYYWTYILKNVAMMGVSAVSSIVILPFAFLLPPLQKKWGLGKLTTVGLFISMFGYLLAFFANENMLLFVIAGVITSLGVIPLSMMFNIFLVDCADYNEWLGNSRMEGTMGSLTGLSAKIGNAFGGFLMGAFLSLVKYDGGLAVQGDAATLMIRLLASLIPMVGYLIVALIMRFYKLDKKLPKIKEELEVRRAEIAQGKTA